MQEHKIINVEEAASLLSAGEVVVIPTETVYGLAANMYNEAALSKIYALKGRPSSNPLIVHIPAADHIYKVAINVPEIALTLAEVFWPGPLTMVLEKREDVSDIISAGQSTVAVRIPDHPLALALLNCIDFPLAAPSANPSNYISPTTIEHVQRGFRNAGLPMVDGGPCTKGIESTVIGFGNNSIVIYRYGAIAVEALEFVSGLPVLPPEFTDKTPSPGMTIKHYSPHTKVIVTDHVQGFLNSNIYRRTGILSLSNFFTHPSICKHIRLSETGNLDEAARNLFASLHEMDTCDLDCIICEKMPEMGLGKAINDRLQRAAANQ